MASDNEYDAQRTFELWLLDYLVKNEMYETAAIFKKETNLPSHSVGFLAPDVFLREWWYFFYDTFTARQPMHQESEVINKTENQSNSIVPQLASDQQRPTQLPAGTDFDMMIGNSATSMSASKFYEEEKFRHSVRDYNPNLRFHNANNMNPLKSAASSSSHPHQQICSQAQLQNIQGSELGRTTPMDPSLYGREGFILPKPGLNRAGMNGGVNTTLQNTWPLDAPNHQQQFQMLTMKHQPELLAPTKPFAPGDLAFNFPGGPASFGCRSPMLLPVTDLRGHNTQMAVQMRKTEANQLQHDHLQHQQLREKGRRKHKSSTSRGKGKSLTNAEGRLPVYQSVESVSPPDIAVDSSASSRILKLNSTANNKNKHEAHWAMDSK